MQLRDYKGIIPAVLVFAGSLVFLLDGIHVGQGVDAPPFHIDEAHKLAETYYYHLAIEERSLNHPAWHQDFYARTNPPVGKYVFGAALAARGLHIRDQKLQGDFERLWRNPAELRKHVPDEMLRVTRYTSATFAAMVCLLVFVIGRRVSGLAAGLIAVGLLLANPYFRVYAQRGLTDSILWFHLTLIVPATFWAIRGLLRHWRNDATAGPLRRWCGLLARTVAIPGLVIALAAGSKLNGALTGPILAVSLVLTALLGASKPVLWRRLGLVAILLAMSAVVAAAVFVVANPYFYHDAVNRATDTVRVFHDWMIKQQVDPGGGLFDVGQKTTATGYFALLSPAQPLCKYLGVLGTWLGALGLVIGATCLIGRGFARRGGPDPADTDASVDQHLAGPYAMAALCWIVVCVVGMTLWLPVAWQRYLMPPYLAICLTMGVGLANLPRLFLAAVDAVTGSSQHLGGTRLAVGAGCVLVSWVVLCFTPWLIDVARLDPTVFPEVGRATRYQPYIEAVRSNPDSATAHRHLGRILIGLGKYEESTEEFESALALLDKSPTDDSRVTVQQCCVLYDLSRALAAMGRRYEALQVLGRHVAAIEKLRDGMVSTDSKVRAGFNQAIADHQRSVNRMLRTPSATHRPAARARK